METAQTFLPQPDTEQRIRFPGVLTSEETIAEMVRQTDTVLLAFSGGKDAIGTWLAIRPHFKRVIPFYRYLIPDLEFVEESLRYYEAWFETRIVRVPNPALYRMLTHLVFQSPRNVPIIEAASLGEFEYREVNASICDDFGLPEDTFVASGVRASDSLQRRRHFKINGPITYSERTFYPIWDWKKSALLNVLAKSGVKLPVDYQIFGRSFDGLRLTYLAPIRRYYPADYARILEFFPMAEMEFERAAYAEKTYTAADFA
jgi:hypothetical protein